MGLTERLATTPERRHGLPCSVGALRDRLDPEEAEALDQMLWVLNWPASRIYEALAEEGHEVGRQTIGRHRARACRCFGTTT